MRRIINCNNTSREHLIWLKEVIGYLLEEAEKYQKELALHLHQLYGSKMKESDDPEMTNGELIAEFLEYMKEEKKKYKRAVIIEEEDND